MRRVEIPRPATSNQPRIETADVKIPKASTLPGPQSTTLAASTQENNIQQIEITAFQDVEAPAVAITPMSQNTTSVSHFDATFDIKEFLRRPTKLWHSQLGLGEGNPISDFVERDPQTPIKQWNFPGDLLSVGGKLEKVKNHQYFKADVKMKLVLNTSPFVAGRFYLTYSPYENSISESRQQKWASRSGLTAYPGVEIDAQLDNSVEITIPFASFKESYVLTTNAENFVTASLYGLTKIKGAVGATMDIAMYAWFENVELNIPTLKDPVGMEPHIQYVERTISPFEANRQNIGRKIEQLRVKNKLAYDYIMKEIGMDKVAGRMQVQAENLTQKGPVESIAGTVKDVAGVVGSLPIPVVSEVAPIVGWVADIVGSISSIFGWSKPNSYAQVAPLQNVPGKFYTHFDSEDQSVSLSLTAKNELDKLYNIFPSAADEMDLGYVCANPAIKYITTWQSVAKAGEQFVTEPILVIPVGIGSFNAKELNSAEGFTNPSVFKANQVIYGCPQDAYPKGGFIPYICFNKAAQLDSKIYDVELRVRGQQDRFLLSTAPCEYVSQLFKYWRATLCFKISVVKTAFHTGRLEIFFDPGMYAYKERSKFIEPDTNFYKDKDTSNNYKYILDLTNDTEVTIRIPFVTEHLFLSTKGLNGGQNLPTPEQVMESIIGALVIRPVTNLMCPDTVAKEVDIVVWKWAEDVVFSCPVNAGGTNLAIYSRDIKNDFPDTYPSDIDHEILRNLPAEIGGRQIMMNCAATEEGGTDPCPDGFLTTDGKCLKVAGSVQINIGNKAEGNVITFFQTTDIEGENMKACKNACGERIVNLRPLLRIFREYVKSEGVLNLTIDPQTEDNLEDPDYLSYLSYMYRFFRGGFRFKIMSDGTRVTSRLTEKANDTGKLTPSHISFPSLNPIHEISLPYYSKYRKLPISSKEAGIMKVQIKGTDVTQADLLRAGNDDLTFGWLMGTPQLVPGNSNVKWTSIDVIANENTYTNWESPNLIARLKKGAPGAPTAP